MIKAEIIADSLDMRGNRLTTFVLEFPRIVLAEFNTHRMISRNSASSRAIPFEKMLKRVETDPFIPIKWMKDHKGMQGNEYFTDKDTYEGEFGIGKVKTSNKLLENWLNAKTYVVKQAKSLNELGLTKQVVNRLLEPFLWHTVIATATDWENFFALRAHEAAEIHIQDLAYKMLDVYNNSNPKLLKKGDWHIPFGNKIDENRIVQQGLVVENQEHEIGDMMERKIQIATARCARVSYLNFEGKDDYSADIKLHDQLLASGHVSPFEHCAQVVDEDRYIGTTYYGNFKGFKQYRKMLDNENRVDNRVINKQLEKSN